MSNALEQHCESVKNSVIACIKYLQGKATDDDMRGQYPYDWDYMDEEERRDMVTDDLYGMDIKGAGDRVRMAHTLGGPNIWLVLDQWTQRLTVDGFWGGDECHLTLPLFAYDFMESELESLGYLTTD